MALRRIPSTACLCAMLLVLLGLPAVVLAEQRRPPSAELLKKLRAQKEERKAALEAEIAKLRARLRPLENYTVQELQLALRIQVLRTYGGAKVFSGEEQPKFLGTIEDEFALDSIFNEFGRYGSRYALDSVWNEFGTYGGEFSLHSPFNRFSMSAPIMVKNGKVIGRLTVNKFTVGAVDPNWLKGFFTY